MDDDDDDDDQYDDVDDVDYDDRQCVFAFSSYLEKYGRLIQTRVLSVKWLC